MMERLLVFENWVDVVAWRKYLKIHHSYVLLHIRENSTESKALEYSTKLFFVANIFELLTRNAQIAKFCDNATQLFQRKKRERANQ